MNYRSMSFHQGHPDPELIKLGAKLGFNDICLQTEGGTLSPLLKLRERADKNGYFKLAKELGMTVSVWVHELEDYDPAWGAVALGNEALWNKLSERYDYILNTLMPEIDYLVLTVVETEIKMTDADLLQKLVLTVLEQCRKSGKKLIFRSFVWHPAEFDQVKRTVERLPDDVMIMTKCVPQDWHLRSIDDPLIGSVGKKDQTVEIDIAGEYFRMDHVANCFTDILEQQFRTWKKNGCDGISVRVDRGWDPEVYQNVVLHEAQEANLWALGYLAAGKPVKQGWTDYAEETFGKKAAPAMIGALKTTGDVIAEGLCVERETFGDTRDKIPAIQVMQSYQGGNNPRYTFEIKENDHAKRFEDSEDKIWSNPFHYNWSLFRWDKRFYEPYRKLRRGDPACIRRKTKQYHAAAKKAVQSILHIDSVKDLLPEGAYEFFRFKLCENLFHLTAMCEMELAWLKCERRLYTDNDEERTDLLTQVLGHIDTLKQLNEQSDESLACKWYGKEYHLHRGEYLDIPGFIRLFSHYWGLEEINNDSEVKP